MGGAVLAITERAMGRVMRYPDGRSRRWLRSIRLRAAYRQRSWMSAFFARYGPVGNRIALFKFGQTIFGGGAIID